MTVTIQNQLAAGQVQNESATLYVTVYSAGGTLRRRHHHDTVAIPAPTSPSDIPEVTWPPSGDGGRDTYDLEISVGADDQHSQSASSELSAGTYTLQYWFPNQAQAIVNYGLFGATGPTPVLDLGFAAENYTAVETTDE